MINQVDRLDNQRQPTSVALTLVHSALKGEPLARETGLQKLTKQLSWHTP
jgi:hypothetical protein